VPIYIPHTAESQQRGGEEVMIVAAGSRARRSTRRWCATSKKNHHIFLKLKIIMIGLIYHFFFKVATQNFGIFLEKYFFADFFLSGCKSKM
jgi:hypothetical protein